MLWLTGSGTSLSTLMLISSFVSSSKDSRSKLLKTISMITLSTNSMFRLCKLHHYMASTLLYFYSPSYAWLRNVSVRNPVARHVSLCFEQWSPEDISNSISHIDYKVLSRVTIPEIKKYMKTGKLNQTPILERSIAVFNVSFYFYFYD